MAIGKITIYYAIDKRSTLEIERKEVTDTENWDPKVNCR